MSISANTATMSSLLQSEANRLAEAQKRHDVIVSIINSLPEASPAPISVENFGYCANASLVFEQGSDAGLSRRLLELYPPVEVVSLLNRPSQKPKKYLRGDEQTTPHRVTYPVLAKQSPSAVSTRQNELQWWTHLAGRDIAVTVKGASKASLQLADDRFTLHRETYNSSNVEYYVPRLKDGFGSPDALALWQNRNGEFMGQQGYSALQRMFGNALLGRVVRSLPAFTMDDLPSPVYMKGGDAIAIPAGVDMSERLARITALQAARKPHPFDRIGDFWRAFTKQEAEALVAFGLEQAQAYAEARAQAEEQVQAVKHWLEGFFAVRPSVRFDCGLEELCARVEQRCRVETGMRVKLVMFPVNSKVQVNFQLMSETTGTIWVPGTREATGLMLLPQDIDVEYA